MKRSRINRIEYPALKPGESCKMERPECGTNVGLQQYTSDHTPLPRKVLRGKFIFSRDPLPRPGKYPKKKVAPLDFGPAVVAEGIGA